METCVVPKETVEALEVSGGSGAELAQCHFHQVLQVKASPKTSPLTFLRETLHILNSRMKAGKLTFGHLLCFLNGGQSGW